MACFDEETFTIKGKLEVSCCNGIKKHKDNSQKQT